MNKIYFYQIIYVDKLKWLLIIDHKNNLYKIKYDTRIKILKKVNKKQNKISQYFFIKWNIK